LSRLLCCGDVVNPADRHCVCVISLFSRQDHDTFLGIWVCDSEVLISIGEVLGDAFCESIKWATEEDVVEGIWYDLHL
jgi:hypothetical protein